jgi:uncharacterized spore protein YtfJ
MAMTDDSSNGAQATVAGNLRGTREAMSTVRGVFGEPYELDGVTVIPVARVMGGGGGGGGEGTGPAEASGRGFGTGFGINAHPLGIYEVRDGTAVWKPVVDVNRLARGGQIVAGILAVGLTLVLLVRRRR